MYQKVGLKPEAQSFLDEMVRRVDGSRCPHCGGVLSFKMDSRIYKKVNSFYGEGPALQEFTLKDGRKCREIIQAEPWSSGPCAFFCLEIDGERMFEWTYDEIQEYL